MSASEMHPYRSEPWEPDAVPIARRGVGVYTAALLALLLAGGGALAWFQWVYDPIAEDPHQADERALRLIAPSEGAEEMSAPVPEREPEARYTATYYSQLRPERWLTDSCSCCDIGCSRSPTQMSPPRIETGSLEALWAPASPAPGRPRDFGTDRRRPRPHRR